MRSKRKAMSVISVLLSLIMILTIVNLPAGVVRAKNDKIGDFVTRCYRIGLGREPDKDGFKYWTTALKKGETCGAYVGYGFIFSDEYTKAKKNDSQYVDDLYQMFLGRKADSKGKKDWVNRLKNGESREAIYAGFANSKEFFKLCQDYGITAGWFLTDKDINQGKNINLFVDRLYTLCLDRKGDYFGQMDWVTKLSSGAITGSDCAHGFVFSKELTGKKLADDAYVNLLYGAIMGREPDEVGFMNWVDSLQSGTTRDEVFAGFVNSTEFGKICKKYGIKKGSYVPTDVSKSKKKTIRVMSYDHEVPDILRRYALDHEDFDWEFEFIVREHYDGYTNALDQELENGNIDIYVVESAYALDYTQGKKSKYAVPYDYIGINVAGKTKSAQTAQYIKDIGTRKSDNKIVGLSYDSNGGAFIYRRSIAKKVWGTDSPKVIKEKIGGGTGSMNQFMQAAKELGAKGYPIVSGLDETYRMAGSAASKGWIQNGKVYVDPTREAFMDTAKQMVSKGYCTNINSWTEDWYEDMADKNKKKVFGYFGPAWLVNYTLTDNCGGYFAGEGTYGDWAVTDAPIGFSWGGSWILIGEASLRGSQRTKIVKDLIEYMTLDTSEEGAQYTLASGTVGGVPSTVSSGKVMSQLKAKRDFLSGQDMFPVYIRANNAATGKNICENQEELDSLWMDEVRQYATGNKSKKQALSDFKERAEYVISR